MAKINSDEYFLCIEEATLTQDSVEEMSRGIHPVLCPDNYSYSMANSMCVLC